MTSQTWEFEVACVGRGGTREEAWEDAKAELKRNLDNEGFGPLNSERIYEEEEEA
jgi:hypothetical protein